MNKLRIISLDDDEVFAFLLESYFESRSSVHTKIEGYFYNTVVSCVKALETLDFVPNMILLDLNMPVMNGFDFLELFQEMELHVKFAETKIFVLSSSLDQKDWERVAGYDIVEGFIEKQADASTMDLILEAYQKTDPSNKKD